MLDESMHWSFVSARKLIEEKGNKDKYVLAAGITPSGTIHIGNFREVMTVDLIVRALKKMGKEVRFIFSWDDFDVFRKVPVNMPEQERLKDYLRMPVTIVPDTYEGCNHKSFADHNEFEFAESLPEVGINPEFINQSIKYMNCDYAEEINFCLKKTEDIKKILNKYREEPLEEGWLPVSIFCDICHKDTISDVKYLGDYKVSYKCDVCDNEETFDFRKKGIIKLNWRVDWPMRWHYEKVDFEPAGKDHFAAGGSRESGVEIIEKLWNIKAPYGFMYEWIAIKGGKEFSSSKGIVTTLKDVLEIYEPEIVRWIFCGTRPNAAFNITFDLDVLNIYESFDKCERFYFDLEEDNEKEVMKQKATYELCVVGEIPKKIPNRLSFRHITTILQFYEMNEEETLNYFIKENKLDKVSQEKVKSRIYCAKNWLNKFAPEEFKFSLNKTKNEEYYSQMTNERKEAVDKFKKLLERFESEDIEELSSQIFEIPKSLNLDMKTFFKDIYNLIVSKDRGPKLAAFVIEAGKDRIISLL